MDIKPVKRSGILTPFLRADEELNDRNIDVKSYCPGDAVFFRVAFLQHCLVLYLDTLSESVTMRTNNPKMGIEMAT